MDARVTTAITIMRQLARNRLLISALSRRLNISPGRLWQLFRKDTGQSPMQYLKGLRMRKAGKLLQSTFLSVKEIAFLSGASDVSHFVRDFKKWFGVTPGEFRARGPLPSKHPMRNRKSRE